MAHNKWRQQDQISARSSLQFVRCARRYGVQMILLLLVILVVVPFSIGGLLFWYIGKQSEVIDFPKYVLLQALIVGLLLSPTFFAMGHGGIPTNIIAGMIAVFVKTGPRAEFGNLLFGVPGGPWVFLEPGLWGAALYMCVKCIARVRP